MKSCVISFRLRETAGAQTVTGVIDARDGLPFAGTYFYFQGGNARLNTLAWAQNGGSPQPTTAAFNFVHGMDLVGRQFTSGLADGDNFGLIYADGSTSSNYSLLECAAGVFVGEQLFSLARVTASRVGEFDLDLFQWPVHINTKSGDDWIVTILGGDDLEVALGPTSTPITGGAQYNLGFPVAGLIGLSSNGVADYPAGTSATGGNGTVDIGFGTSNGNKAAVGVAMTPNAYWNPPAGTHEAVHVLTDGTTTYGDITAWLPEGFQVGAANNSFGGAPAVFGGVGIVANCGAFTQPLATGTQTITTNIDAKWIMLASVGYPAAGTDVLLAQTAMSVGFTDGQAQFSFWSGEPNSRDVSDPPIGARYMSDSTLLRFGTANSGSTTFDAVASLVNVDPDGVFTINWSSVDAVSRQIVWFALGEAVAQPHYHTRTLIRRRVRRAPVTWAEHDGLQTRISVSLFAVDMQPATATADTPDPQVMVRASKDGGHTWTDWRHMSAGAVGQYTTRLNAWRWGSGRQWVFEVATSDPVTYNLLNAYMHATPGGS